MSKLELLPKSPPADSSSEQGTASHVHDASQDFDDAPDADESLLKRWLALAEAVLQESGSGSPPLDGKNGKTPPPK